MKYVAISAIALLSLSSAAWAQSAPTSPPPSLAPAQTSMSLQPGDRFVRNANECAGEDSRAAWGRNGALIGYSCYENPNGG
jgi:hypothetical protein